MPATVESAWRCSSGGASRLPRAPNRAYSADTMTGGTTIAGQIERLITRLDGAAVCDGCVTDRLNLSVPAQAHVVTRALRSEERRVGHDGGGTYRSRGSPVH